MQSLSLKVLSVYLYLGERETICSRLLVIFFFFFFLKEVGVERREEENPTSNNVPVEEAL